MSEGIENQRVPRRITVPLTMLPGNMDILLNNMVPCKGVSLRWSPEYEEAVILVFHGADKDVCAELGFRFEAVADGDDDDEDEDDEETDED